MRDDPWRRSPHRLRRHTKPGRSPSRTFDPDPLARMTALALASSPTRRAARSRHPSCPFRSYFEGDYPGTVAAIRPVAEVSRHLVLQNRRAAGRIGQSQASAARRPTLMMACLGERRHDRAGVHAVRALDGKAPPKLICKPLVTRTAPPYPPGDSGCITPFVPSRVSQE